MSLDNIYPGAVQLFAVVVENGTVHFWDSNNTGIINIEQSLPIDLEVTSIQDYEAKDTYQCRACKRVDLKSG